MKRRQILNSALLGATTLTALGACNSNSQSSQSNSRTSSLPQIEWRMATSWPTSLDTIYGGAQMVCDQVKAMTGGRFTIQPYAAGEIVGGLEIFDAVQNGAIECGHSASYYYIGKNSALAFASSVPFGFNPQQQNAWLYHGKGLEQIHKIYADFNLITFPGGNTGAQMGGWFKREINTVEDLKGLKMRIPGLGGKVMERLGVNAQVLPGGEIYLALERGAIDAAEWVGPYDDEKLGLHKAAKYYYYPSWWEPGPTLDVFVNLTEWEKLPKEYQEIFKTATYQANINMLAQYEALNPEALQRLIKSGTILKPYSPEILKAAEQETFALYDEMVQENPAFKEIYEQWKTFREQIKEWQKINELSFANFVNQN